MIAISGISKFPIYLEPDGKKTIGIAYADKEFSKYVTKKKHKWLSVHIKEINFKQFHRRIIIGNKAYNPTDQEKWEFIPQRIYTYPSQKYDQPITNVMAYGLRIKSRKLIFYPMLIIRSLDEDEIRIITKTITIKQNDIPLVLQYIGELGFEFTTQQQGDNFVLRVVDEFGQRYGVLIDKDGRFLETNVCFTPHTDMYLLEAMIMLRRNYHHIYGESGYNWLL